ncbi:adenylate/guanylate cyclase domain-containing protein [Leptospira sp. 96542]|nr:adenylate/guanylate cyclase domain-containing protein [Leptospira sp. 96542]
MSASQGLFHLFFDVPPSVPLRHRRMYYVALIGFFLALLLHASWLVAFSVLGIYPLAYFNILSVAIFVLGLYIIRSRGLILSMMLLGSFEVLVHQTLAVYLMGWDYGFQFYVIVIASFICLGHFHNLAIPLGVAAFSGLLFILLYFVVQHLAGEHYLLAEPIRAAFFAMNSSVLFLQLTIFAFLFSTAARNAELELKNEHEKSERLLLNILPRSVAERLKAGEKQIADNYNEVSVLFSDMVGFTSLSLERKPEEVVQIMNTYFAAFDELAVQHGVEKIKTIGDAYMCAAGLPTHQPNHAILIGRMAVDMLAASKRITAELGLPTGIRIGICSGPVSAGVLGNMKFIYDIWGDTVNMASRMETSAPHNAIQVAESTYNLLKGDFPMQRRGRMKVKGRGEADVYLIGEPEPGQSIG